MAIEQTGQGGSVNDLVTQLASMVKNQGLILQVLQSIDGKLPAPFVGVPATSASSGTTGQMALDATHFYLCVATNSWIRFTGSTF